MNLTMESRCPYPACKHSFVVADENDAKILGCPLCGQELTVRSLARYQEIDKQFSKQLEKGTAITEDTLLAKELPPLIAILEEIRSLWNVGSIFRSADGAGIKHLFLLGITGCPPRKEISKTSLGAEEHITWNYAAGAQELLPALRKRGYQIIGLEKTDTSIDLKSAISQKQIKKPLCLIVGNEVTGMYKESLNACDLVCHLPMRGFKESLNVAVAFGIAAYAVDDVDSSMSSGKNMA